MEINQFFEFMLLLFLFLFPSEMMVQVGAKECKYKSRLFRGMCIDNDKCFVICQSEGFERGQCEGIIHRTCMCTKSCGGPPPYVEPPPPPYVEEPPPPYAEEPPPPFAEEPPPPYGEEVHPTMYDGSRGGGEDGKRGVSGWGGGDRD